MTSFFNKILSVVYTQPTQIQTPTLTQNDSYIASQNKLLSQFIKPPRVNTQLDSPSSSPLASPLNNFKYSNTWSRIKSLHKSSSHNNSPNNSPLDQYRNRSGSFIILGDFSKLGTLIWYILEHPELGVEFRNYAALKFADEGIKFLDQIFNSNIDVSKNNELLINEIMNNNFITDAHLKINIKSSCSDNLHKLYNNKSYKNIYDLFIEPIKEVFDDLKNSDTLRTFMKSHNEIYKLIDNENTILVEKWLNLKNLDESYKFTDQINLLKFCVSMCAYEQEQNLKLKKNYGNKIINMYIAMGSPLTIPVHKMYYELIISGEQSILLDIKQECLRKLSQNKELIRHIKISQNKNENENIL